MRVFTTGIQDEKGRDNRIYRLMNQHTSRVSAYKKAIDSAITASGKNQPVVLEVGAGYGEMSIYAAKRGCRVYSIDSNHEAAESLRADARGLDLKVIEGDARNAAIPERADIIVSELIGNLGPDFAMGTILDYSRDRFLKKNGIMIPQGVKSFMQYSSDFKNLSDIQFGIIKDYYTSFSFDETSSGLLLGEPANVWTYEWNKQNSNIVKAELPYVQGANSIIGYFSARLFEDICLDNHPSKTYISWRNLFLPIGKSTNSRHVEGDVKDSGFEINSRACEMIVFSQSSITSNRENIWQQLYRLNNINDAPVCENYSDWVKEDAKALLYKTRAPELEKQIESLRDPHVELMLKALNQKGILLVYNSSGLDGSLDWLPENAREFAKVNLFDSCKIRPAYETSSDSSKKQYTQSIASRYGIKPGRIVTLSTHGDGINTHNLSMREVFEKVI